MEKIDARKLNKEVQQQLRNQAIRLRKKGMTYRDIAEIVGVNYNFDGLRHYKEKFEPVWEPRYLASPGGLALPVILTHLVQLISGQYYQVSGEKLLALYVCPSNPIFNT